MYRTIFKNKRTVLPVIHVEDVDQVSRNIDLVKEEGADGVFLVNHSIPSQELLGIYETVSSNDFWIGLNLLDLSPVSVFHNALSADGVWIDDAMIDERVDVQSVVDDLQKHRDSFDGLYFGGVAFKYRREVEDVETAAKIATRYMDVVTTSGDATGEEADVSKIKRMKEAIGDFPLAIASGITPENVDSYLPYVDCFLVASLT